MIYPPYKLNLYKQGSGSQLKSQRKSLGEIWLTQLAGLEHEMAGIYVWLHGPPAFDEGKFWWQRSLESEDGAPHIRFESMKVEGFIFNYGRWRKGGLLPPGEPIFKKGDRIYGTFGMGSTDPGKSVDWTVQLHFQADVDTLGAG